MDEFDKISVEITEKSMILDDIDKIIDYNYIKKNVHWFNHGDPSIIFSNGKVNKWYYFNDNTKEINEFYFDEVICGGFHGIGMRYQYLFKLNNEYNLDVGYYKFAPTINKLNYLLNTEDITVFPKFSMENNKTTIYILYKLRDTGILES